MMATGRPAELSVIIVNWNTRELLRRCLDSLAADAGTHALETIVVDNGSRDGSREMLRAEYPGVVLIENAHNAGFARANNQGAERASAPLLLLLNSDAAVLPGALASALMVMRAHPHVGIAGLRLLNDDRTLQPSGKRFPTLASTIVGLLPVPERWRHAYDAWRNRRDDAGAEGLSYVDEVSGAAMVVHRALFRDLGGFDPAFYFFGEDVDLCWRAHERGHAVAYLPSARVIHSWGGARRSTPTVRQGLLSQRAQLLLIRRHRPAWHYAVLRLFVIALTALRAARAAWRALRRPDPSTNAIANLYTREFKRLLQR